MGLLPKEPGKIPKIWDLEVAGDGEDELFLFHSGTCTHMDLKELEND